MKRLGAGVTRTVYEIRGRAVKVPWGLAGYRPKAIVRGILANRSEWQQRDDVNVHAPLRTLAYVVNVYPVAEVVPRGRWWIWDVRESIWAEFMGYTPEEAKPSSWGCVNGRWALIDYDRCWDDPKGWLGAIYYWDEERLARKWARLPDGAAPDPDRSSTSGTPRSTAPRCLGDGTRSSRSAGT